MINVSQDATYIYIQKGDRVYVQRKDIVSFTETPISGEERLIIDLANHILEQQDEVI